LGKDAFYCARESGWTAWGWLLDQERGKKRQDDVASGGGEEGKVFARLGRWLLKKEEGRSLFRKRRKEGEGGLIKGGRGRKGNTTFPKA